MSELIVTRLRALLLCLAHNILDNSNHLINIPLANLVCMRE